VCSRRKWESSLLKIAVSREDRDRTRLLQRKRGSSLPKWASRKGREGERDSFKGSEGAPGREELLRMKEGLLRRKLRQ